MMMIYTLVSENNKHRVYKVVSDNDEGTIIVNKQTHEASSQGAFSSMFSKEFIEKLAVGTLKFKTNPPKEFTYGVG
ncbi:hypothetical protein [Companilactobacillus futsaii]|uniref:Uncharacterized protein n=2 Tax=Companilactobacillus futsaii TaxID=938155 RepID=A0A5B7T466_9LACO|nr:hypothetical protein [Companilactobacillus futsaii]QCX25184.1 hypothetical protein FG051_08690 [Companilactobacillus futsaii]